MSVEIERKFRVDSNKLKLSCEGKLLCQAYLSRDPSRTVRIRIAGNEAFLTIKGPSNGISRAEFEYPIPVTDAEELMQLAVFPPIIKTRHKIQSGHLYWEIDIFHGENEGLILAEIELNSEHETFVLPEWITTEVSGDLRFFNSYLAQHPFSQWPENKK